jgi:hypothetical protein
LGAGRSLSNSLAFLTFSLLNFIYPILKFYSFLTLLHSLSFITLFLATLYPYPLMHYSLALDAASSTFFQNFLLEVPTRIPDLRGGRIKGKL